MAEHFEISSIFCVYLKISIIKQFQKFNMSIKQILHIFKLKGTDSEHLLNTGSGVKKWGKKSSKIYTQSLTQSHRIFKTGTESKPLETLE